MKTTQPPITTDQEFAGYRAGAEQLRQMLEHEEADLMTARHEDACDIQHVDEIRYQLHHLYGYYTGIQDAIDAYVHQKHHA